MSLLRLIGRGCFRAKYFKGSLEWDGILFRRRIFSFEIHLLEFWNLSLECPFAQIKYAIFWKKSQFLCGTANFIYIFIIFYIIFMKVSSFKGILNENFQNFWEDRIFVLKFYPLGIYFQTTSLNSSVIYNCAGLLNYMYAYNNY